MDLAGCAGFMTDAILPKFRVLVFDRRSVSFKGSRSREAWKGAKAAYIYSSLALTYYLFIQFESTKYNDPYLSHPAHFPLLSPRSTAI